MAVGISPKLPLDKGFDVNKTIAAKILQNMKMVLLTSPGERIGLPKFGVGLRRFLFEPLTNATLARLESKIRQQLKAYVPDARIENVLIDSPLTNVNMQGSSDHQMVISIDYKIPTIAKSLRMSLLATSQTIIVQ
tara:strand:+ start:923 stop:1327 length:405 start_codon:yes stop_codon:yes gene_type:complete